MSDKWQPIETAPKDGTWVVLSGGIADERHYDEHCEKPPMVIAAYDYNEYYGEGEWIFCSYDGGQYGEYDNPTHWMPIPTPPSDGG